MANDPGYMKRISAQNRRMEKNHDRSTGRWADKLVARQAAKARATRSCPSCERGVRKDARFCEHCGEELA